MELFAVEFRVVNHGSLHGVHVLLDRGVGCGVVTYGGDGCGVVTDGGDDCDVLTEDVLVVIWW